MLDITTFKILKMEALVLVASIGLFSIQNVHFHTMETDHSISLFLWAVMQTLVHDELLRANIQKVGRQVAVVHLQY